MSLPPSSQVALMGYGGSSESLQIAGHSLCPTTNNPRNTPRKETELIFNDAAGSNRYTPYAYFLVRSHSPGPSEEVRLNVAYIALFSL